MLDHSVDEILYTDKGIADGIRHGEEVAKAKYIIGDPSYFPKEKTRVTGRCVCVCVCVCDYGLSACVLACVSSRLWIAHDEDFSCLLSLSLYLSLTHTHTHTSTASSAPSS